MLQGKLTQIPEAAGQGPCRLRAGLVSAPHEHPEGCPLTAFGLWQRASKHHRTHWSCLMTSMAARLEQVKPKPRSSYRI